MKISFASLLLGFGAFLLAGCGGVGTLTGTVEFQGKQLKTGTVTVTGPDNSAYPAALDEAGKFKIENIPPGLAKIAVDSPNPNPVVPMDPLLAKKPVRPDGPQVGAVSPAKGSWFPIPEKYGEAAKSGLTFEIKRGENQFNIKLQ
ncbi:MAG: hypothetical protein EXR99_13500 [Gemmataceae bacterium]|nr:hypothetical protein [Gemmataceae bacterium]